MTETLSERVILGLDPGLARLGFGVVSVSRERMRALDYGVFRTRADEGEAARIEALATCVEGLLAEYPITEAALEKIHFARYARSVLNVVQVRGALLLVLERARIPIATFASNTVKLAVRWGGEGHASKAEVAQMCARLLGLEEPPAHADASDALAIAITAAAQHPIAGQLA